MISKSILHKLSEAGVQVDMLGQPIKVGDMVLTKGYYSSMLNHFGVVKRVNKKSISVDVTYSNWEHGTYNPRPNGHVGYWNTYPDAKYVEGTKAMKRISYECLLVSPEQQALAEARERELIGQYPELFI